MFRVITGIAVNLATRVSQKAADGEFWVSSTVRDMMLGGNTTFSDRGQHALKAFDDPWRHPFTPISTFAVDGFSALMNGCNWV